MTDPLFDIEGRVALVTGATGGIGSMIARTLLSRGARTYIVGRSAATCDATRDALAAAGDCQRIVADISTAEGRQHVAAELAGQEDRLHILVNNAGSLSMTPFEAVTEEEWDAEMAVNLKAAFFLTQALITPLRAGGTADRPAAVINIGSIGGLTIRPRENYAYQASKAGLHHLTRALARHLAPQHINVNAIAPGIFPSGMTPAPGDPIYDSVIQGIPCRRIGMLDDIAALTLLLASRGGAFVNGTVIPLDGGLSL